MDLGAQNKSAGWPVCMEWEEAVVIILVKYKILRSKKYIVVLLQCGAAQ